VVLLKSWLSDEQQGAWCAQGQVDFAVTLESHRLRASAFAHTQGCSLALRLLPEQCPQLHSLGTPRAIPELLTRDNGLILVTGATGSGKSTTLAAMVDFLNHHSDGHILIRWSLSIRANVAWCSSGRLACTATPLPMRCGRHCGKIPM